MKTRPGGFRFSEIRKRIMRHVARAVFTMTPWQRHTFPAPRRGWRAFTAEALHRFAKGAVADVEAVICEALPDLSASLSGREGRFDLRH